MKSARLAAFLIGLTLALLGPGATGQEKGAKEDPKAEKKDDKKDDKKGEAKEKTRGQLPPNWGKLGLSEDQKQAVYALQAKNAEEVDKLKAQIKALDAKLTEERFKILTPDQKKRLEAAVKAKSGADK